MTSSVAQCNEVTAQKMTMVWNEVEIGLNEVIMKVPMTPKRYMQLYSKVFTSCTAQQQGRNTSSTDFIGLELYRKLTSYMENVINDILEKGVDKKGEALLRFYHYEWTEFCFVSKVIDGIFSYLNRHWIKREVDEGKEEIYLIYTLCLVTWRKVLFSKLDSRVTDAALELIRLDRLGEKVDKGLIASVRDSYVDLGCDEDSSKKNMINNDNNEELDGLGVYREHFERSFLECTESFYEYEAQEFMAMNPLTEYMKKVEKRLIEEGERCMRFLHKTTEKKLLKCCETVLIKKRLQAFQGEFGGLLEQRKDDDLARMYKLCEKVENGLENLRQALENHITKEGQQTMENTAAAAEKDPKLYVNTLLEVYDRYFKLVTDAFKNDVGFIQALDKAASNFVNKNAVTMKTGSHNPNKSPELLSRFTDGLLRKSNKMLDEEELEKMLCQVMTIFKYIEDKDIFSKFYTKMFSKRLITEISASEEAEVSFIGKLKHACGFEYTNRMSKMVSDVQISKELTSGFKEFMSEKNGGKTIDSQILVLSTGSWPTMPTQTFHLPAQLAISIDNFNKFYEEKHNGRKLNWVLSQSRGEITSTAFGGKKIFMATSAQMTVLMLYNEGLKFTAKDICEKIGMDKKTMVQTVASLVKNEVLTGKDSDGKTDYADEEMFALNTSYKNKKVKIDLSRLVMRADPKQEQAEVTKNVEEDRKNVIMACIVRIMKMRKTINHQQLMAEVLQQLSSRFKPRVEQIKKCIGILMEKEYMRRSEEARDVYEYIA